MSASANNASGNDRNDRHHEVMRRLTKKRKKRLYVREENYDDVVIDEEFARSKGCAMPELVSLLDDAEVLEHLKKPRVTELLREITLDPSKIPSLIGTEELTFLKHKMMDLIRRTYPDEEIHDF